MNIFKKMYCRIYQGIFKIMIPLLPYREPKILKDYGELIEILKQENIKSVMIVTDEGIRSLGLTRQLEDEITGSGIKLVVYDKTVPNPTTANVEEAYEMYKQGECQFLIGFGGGSPIDCAKAVGVRVAKPNKPLSKLKGVLKVGKKLPPLLAIPTTAGTGSETTLASVITDATTHHKYAINDFPLIPKYAILDEKLTAGLPKKITATTGMDALTHAVEAYIGRSTTKDTRKNAEEAVKLIFENLPECCNNGGNLTARKNMLYAAYYAGLAFTKSYVGYVHAIAHSLGGKYNVAHGLANAVILPYMLKKYGKKIDKKLWKLGVYSGLFKEDVTYEEGAKIFIEKIENMNKEMGIESTIKEIEESDIEELAKTAEKEANPLYPVPVLFTRKQLEEIYRQVRGE